MSNRYRRISKRYRRTTLKEHKPSIELIKFVEPKRYKVGCKIGDVVEYLFRDGVTWSVHKGVVKDIDGIRISICELKTNKMHGKIWYEKEGLMGE